MIESNQIVDRSLNPRPGNVLIVIGDNGINCKRLGEIGGHPHLLAANDAYLQRPSIITTSQVSHQF